MRIPNLPEQPCSSVLSPQSTVPSHFLKSGIHSRLIWQLSEWFSWWNLVRIANFWSREVWSCATYWKVSSPHSEQFFSSEWSTQSSMPLQRSRESMQSPLSHWNSLARQAPIKVLCKSLLDYDKTWERLVRQHFYNI